jgi:hypothetical protein
VEAEHLRQDPGGRLVAVGDVHPDQPVVAGQQCRQVLDRILLDAVIGHEANVHPAGHLLEAVIPLAGLAPMPTVPAQQPDGAPRGLWWDQTRAASELGE